MLHIIILAGGLGTRLGNVTKEIPKPMVPVAGRPFLTHVLDRLPENSNVILCVGYLKERVKEYFGDRYKSLTLNYSEENYPLGTGGATLQAIRRFPGERNICLINGDTFFDLPIIKFMLEHEKTDADITLAVKPMRNFDRYGRVELDQNNCITAFYEKTYAEYGLINGGVYALNAHTVLYLGLPDIFSFEKDLLEKYVNTLKIAGSIYDSYFIDIGVPEDLERAERDLS